jgi:hypothetical protein
MTRIRTFGLCAIAVAATATATVANASAAPPEFGRCVKVAKGTGTYATGNCTTIEGANKNYEWMPGPGPKPGFTLTLESWYLEGATSKTKIACTIPGTGSGEITGEKTVTVTGITLHSCEPGGGQCEDPGSPYYGTIHLPPMTGELGRIKAGATGPLTDQIGLTFSGEFEFECAGGAARVVVSGSAIGKISPTHGMTTRRKWVFKVLANTRQWPERFEAGLKQAFGMTVNGTPEGAGLGMSPTLTSEEKLEINTVI